MLTKFSGVELERSVSKCRKRKKKCLCCVHITYFMKRGRETRNHSCDSRATTAEKYKRNVMHVQSCCFADLKLFFFVIVAFAVVVA